MAMDTLNDSWRERLPATIIDAHAHLYDVAREGGSVSHPLGRELPQRSMGHWATDMRQLLGGRDISGVFMGFPFVGGQPPQGNAYVREQIEPDAGARQYLLVTPQSDRQVIEQQLADDRVVGFKPYHIYAQSTRPTFDAPPGDYIPDWVCELAGERKRCIMLHLVRDHALADPVNWRWLRDTTERHPGIRFILAHAARGFDPRTTIDGLEHLATLDNIWFDNSVVCESAALLAILDAFGPRRLLFGSDYPVSLLRGKAIGVGSGFVWLSDDNFDWSAQSPRCEPASVGTELMRAMFGAMDEYGLNDADVEDIFAGNARRLFEIDAPPPQCDSLYRHSKSRIPGGTQLLSKRPEQFAPNQWPAYFREARGCEVWDVDGRHFFDFSLMGIGTCPLGYRDPHVTAAVLRRVRLGAMSTLNPPEEVELANLLCDMHPWADQARFARCGGEAMAAAVRIARATTGRDRVAICGYHGWHDWYLSVNLADGDGLRGHLLPGLDPAGVPEALRGSAVTFHYNNFDEFNAAIDAHGDALAAVVMEPCRDRDPAPGFLEQVRERTARCGAMWIVDEITIGFRLAPGGAHLKYGVTPDIAVFAKALGAGHPMAAIIGTADAMRGAHDSFISSTYWTESVGPAAALAAVQKMRRIDLPARLDAIGSAVRAIWREAAERYGLPLTISGFPCLSKFTFDHEQGHVLRTLFTQWMLDEGFLAGNAFYASLAHRDDVVTKYRDAVNCVFERIADCMGDDLTSHLRGPVAHEGFRRLM
jgi:glutamate-1-semialdehyde 2,1-aminomutase